MTPASPNGTELAPITSGEVVVVVMFASVTKFGEYPTCWPEFCTKHEAGFGRGRVRVHESVGDGTVEGGVAFSLITLNASCVPPLLAAIVSTGFG